MEYNRIEGIKRIFGRIISDSVIAINYYAFQKSMLEGARGGAFGDVRTAWDTFWRDRKIRLCTDYASIDDTSFLEFQKIRAI